MIAAPVVSAEQHAVALISNTLDWLLSEGELTPRGLWGVLTAARTQLTAAQTMIGPGERT